MKKIFSMFSWSSLKGKILTAFVVTAVIPSFILIFFSYINTSRIVRDNVEELMQANIQQTKSSLDVWVDSYEDILFQVYMNDDIVDMVDDINQGEDITATKARLRSTLRGMFYAKEHIKCITVITESGEVVFYDLLTGSSTRTSWMGSIGMSQDEIYENFSLDNFTHIIPTRRAGVFAADVYYLFHLGHRIIDYQNVNKQIGVVIVSVDEAMLREICGKSDDRTHFTFMVDTQGNMISCYEEELLGTKVMEWSDDIEKRKQSHWKFLKENNLIGVNSETIEIVYDEEFGADIVNVSSQQELIKRLNAQQRILLFVLGVTVFILLILIVTMTRNLMSSINRLVRTMKIAEEGKLSVRAVVDRNTPTEIRIIETQFNHMMDELESSIKKEKEAYERQRNAEIAALEAQINPHFLYNTLDTINWMAIDRDEFEISNSITSLAAILRYGIDDSNAEVKIGREIEWLKQYLFLQQTRLKNAFECEINVSPEVVDWRIHKLLFQPFVENAIFHGFKSKKGVHLLKINIEPRQDRLMIQIWDNGKGMSEELVKMINSRIYPASEDKNCIGMENAITRIQMYYGEMASVYVESSIEEYTSVWIYIPRVPV